MWPHLVNAVLAAWLILAPAVLAYGGALATNDRIVGPIAAVCALVAAWETTRGVRHANILLGAWLMVAPLLFAAGGAAMVNSMLVGLATLVLAVRGAHVRGRFDGGWRAVWTRRAA